MDAAIFAKNVDGKQQVLLVWDLHFQCWKMNNRLKVLNGELGEERQKLSSEYLHFEVNCSAKEYYCPNCKAIRTQYVLDTTFSEPTKEGLKPIVKVPYEHVCEKCHTKLKKYCGQQLLCEKCGGEVEPSGLMILWD